MLFLFLFSISPIPSSTLVMSYILRFCLTSSTSVACKQKYHNATSEQLKIILEWYAGAY